MSTMCIYSWRLYNKFNVNDSFCNCFITFLNKLFGMYHLKFKWSSNSEVLQASPLHCLQHAGHHRGQEAKSHQVGHGGSGRCLKMAVDQEGRAEGGVELPGHKPGLDQPRLRRLEVDSSKTQNTRGTQETSRTMCPGCITGWCMFKEKYKQTPSNNSRTKDCYVFTIKTRK